MAEAGGARGPGRGHIPHACGVYLMRDAGGAVLYVGKAKDLARRVAQYFTGSARDRKTSLLAPLVRRIDYVPCASERESLLWERRLIRRYQPFFNSLWKDDKSYPYVKVTLGEDFPRLRMTRKRRRDGGAYFGPFPKVSAVQALLRRLWTSRLFPLRPCDWEFSVERPLDRRKIKACLYYHTGQCPAPCAGNVSREDYRRIAHDAALFFGGAYGRLESAWRSEMRAAAARLDYERAASLRDQLGALEHMSERVRCESVRPEDLGRRLDASAGATALQEALGLARPPHHIEAFDISHLQGRLTVGSMVCFQGGEPQRSHYRRFRVGPPAGNDDFRSMREVVFRRYRPREAPRPGERPRLENPDLALIDGGKGQLAAALEALAEARVKLPVAALAKREEEVFVPGRPEPILLDRASPALRLLQRLRDEAHRFAVTYHKLLRKKKLLGAGA